MLRLPSAVVNGGDDDRRSMPVGWIASTQENHVCLCKLPANGVYSLTIDSIRDEFSKPAQRRHVNSVRGRFFRHVAEIARIQTTSAATRRPAGEKSPEAQSEACCSHTLPRLRIGLLLESHFLPVASDV
jgi:hypothetical protein